MGIMTYWPVIAMVVPLALAGAGGYVDLRLTDNNMTSKLTNVVDDVSTNVDDIESNEEAIEEIQRILIERQGKIDLDVQQLKNDIDKQDLKLDQLLDILQDIQEQTE